MSDIKKLQEQYKVFQDLWRHTHIQQTKATDPIEAESLGRAAQGFYDKMMEIGWEINAIRVANCKWA